MDTCLLKRFLCLISFGVYPFNDQITGLMMTRKQLVESGEKEKARGRWQKSYIKLIQSISHILIQKMIL